MSNFAFLQPEWVALHEAATQAESLANTDACASCFYARRALEIAVAWLYKHDKSLRLPYQDNLAALIHEPTFRKTVGDAIFTKAKVLKDVGNLAVHSSRKIAPSDAVATTRELFHVCFWLARNYGQRLRRNQQLTPTDLAELENMLIDAGGTKALIDHAKEQSHGLGIFIRSLVGLDRETATAAFSNFISGTTDTADQIEFINLIVEELTQNGTMEPERLYQTPFIDISPQGPDGLFPSATVGQLIVAIREISLGAVG